MVCCRLASGAPPKHECGPGLVPAGPLVRDSPCRSTPHAAVGSASGRRCQTALQSRQRQTRTVSRSSISPLGTRTSGTPCTSRLAYLERLQAMSQPPIICRSVTIRGCPAMRPPTQCDTSNSGRPWRRATPPSFPTRSVCPAGSRMDTAVPNRCLVGGLFGAITTRQACSVPHTVQLGGSHQPIQWVWKPERTRGLRAAPTVA